MESLSDKKRVRSDSDEHTLNSLEAKRLRHDLLDSVEDPNEYTFGQDLDSFIKSFEDEIYSHSDRVDQASDSGESRPGLEFLLEAADDELGLPPTDSVPTESEKVPSSTESGGLGLYSLLDIYDSFEYGFDYEESNVGVCNDDYNGEYVALDGLFD